MKPVQVSQRWSLKVCQLCVLSLWQTADNWSTHCLWRTQSGHRSHMGWLTTACSSGSKKIQYLQSHVHIPSTMIYTLKPEMCYLAEGKSNQIHSKGQPSHTVADKVIIIIIIIITSPWHLKVDNYTIVFSTKPNFENTNNTQIKSFCDHSEDR